MKYKDSLISLVKILIVRCTRRQARLLYNRWLSTNALAYYYVLFLLSYLFFKKRLENNLRTVKSESQL